MCDETDRPFSIISGKAVVSSDREPFSFVVSHHPSAEVLPRVSLLCNIERQK